MLLSPDGHLQDNMFEYLHWFVWVNIFFLLFETNDSVSYNRISEFNKKTNSV